jgi:hypothetical protein
MLFASLHFAVWPVEIEPAFATMAKPAMKATVKTKIFFINPSLVLFIKNTQLVY